MGTESEQTEEISERTEILFRQLVEPVVTWSKPGLRWAVEFWCWGIPYPVGQAWVGAYPPMAGGSPEPYAHIDWMHVQEQYRRQGVGTSLMEAIKARWPDVDFDAATELGNKFLAALPEEGEVKS